MEALVHEFLDSYGPLAVFVLLMLSGVGIALGEEMVTIPAGILIAGGEMNAAATAVCAYVAIVCADIMWFLICRHYGRPLLHKPWMKRLVHPRRLLQVKHQLDRRGVWFVVMARFIPSSRTTAITVAGMFNMRFLPFALATAGCVLVTVPFQLGLGYFIGKGMADQPLADRLLAIIGIIAIIVTATTLLSWWLGRSARTSRAPRARASWLRGRGRRRRKTNGTDDAPGGAAPKTSPDVRSNDPSRDSSYGAPAEDPAAPPSGGASDRTTPPTPDPTARAGSHA